MPQMGDAKTLALGSIIPSAGNGSKKQLLASRSLMVGPLPAAIHRSPPRTANAVGPIMYQDFTHTRGEDDTLFKSI